MTDLKSLKIEICVLYRDHSSTFYNMHVGYIVNCIISIYDTLSVYKSSVGHIKLQTLIQ